MAALLANQQEWLKSNDPLRLYQCARHRTNPRLKKVRRKFRLYACACCYAIWGQLRPEGQVAVALSERYADGKATIEELRAAHLAAIHASRNDANARRRVERVRQAMWNADYAVESAAGSAITKSGRMAARAARRAARSATVNHPAVVFRQMGRHQAALLRDIFGHVFHRGKVDSAWRTSTVTQLAAQIYDDRAFDRLPILGDALEEAGCTDAAILDHCRGDGPHVRGCWIVDLLMGRN